MRKKYQRQVRKSNHKFEVVRGQELMVRVPLPLAEVWAEMQTQVEELTGQAGLLLDSVAFAVYRRLLKMALEELRLIDEQIGQLDQEMASLLRQHRDAVERLAEVPGLGVDSAQQIIAEVGPTAATFPSEKCLSSWAGACPGDEESAGVNYSHRSPQGNRHMRRLLNQAANAAARTKGSIFEIVYRRSVLRLGHNQAIGAIAHRQCRLIWLILHQGVHYEERGPAVSQKSKRARTARMIRQLRSLGYQIEPPNLQPSQAQAQ